MISTIYHALQFEQHKKKKLSFQNMDSVLNKIKCGNDFLRNDKFSLEWSGILSCGDPHSKLVVDCFKLSNSRNPNTQEGMTNLRSAYF
jgi:hypothetical protein